MPRIRAVRTVGCGRPLTTMTLKAAPVIRVPAVARLPPCPRIRERFVPVLPVIYEHAELAC